ncbi:UDP-Glc:alpha-D-GlcNAc-diphosphoundecaprenol beta-1,3-glucosyltransferase WfgD [Gordonia rubripertincta]|nr:UDP-Glc:alpha-D-GlcNAc-diphosphoundecaprenol beta-1,3-glucosyltransferase WfgD [Gordonia rubripertincta]
MPAHNVEKFIRWSVVSTLRALPDDSELVVGCDGCTDRTGSILDSIKDARLRCLVFESNQGVAATLNKLVDATDSEIVSRMDADDICLPWRFRYQLQGLASNELQFANVVHYRGPYAVPRPVVPYPIEGSIVPLLLLLENPLAHPTLITTRRTLTRLGGYRNVPAEDYDLWVRAVLDDVPIKRRPLATVMYRHHGSQATTAADANRRKSMSEEMASAHRDLCERVTGRRYSCWSALRNPSSASAEEKAELQALCEYLLEQGRTRGPRDMRMLHRAISRVTQHATARE